MISFTEFLTERAMFQSLIGTVVTALDDAGVKHKHRKSTSQKGLHIVTIRNKIELRVTDEFIEVWKGSVVVDSGEFDDVDNIVTALARNSY